MKLIISDKQDREALALILVKAGYTVRIGKTNINGKSVNYVEYEEKE